MSKKKFLVNYWEHIAIARWIEAETEEEAEANMKKLVENDEIDHSNMAVGDYGFEVVKEEETNN